MTVHTQIVVEDVISQFTLQEKIALVSGLDSWHTYPVHRLGVPSLRITDGPNGVRGTKFFGSVPTSCVPSGTALASSWNKELMYEVGTSMGKQARAKGAHVLMGPNINLARSPLSGRTFETLGEDPFLSGLLASSYCQGIHEQGVMVCPKHLVTNDKEDYRMTMQVQVSDRALRELYLMPFMLVQKYANPDLYMTAYSKLNGPHCSENKKLIKDIVSEEWGFKGCFVSDWFGTVSCADSINAGLSLEMPGPSIWRGKLLEMSVFHNTVTEETLDCAVRGVLSLVNKALDSGVPENAFEGMRDDEEATAIARKAATESIVLLKNENQVLPFHKKKTLIIGEAAKKPNYASGGCANVTPYRVVSLYDAAVDYLGAGNVDWCVGAPNRKSLPSFSEFAVENSATPIKFAVYDDPRSVKGRKPILGDNVSEIDAILGDYDPAKLRNANQLYAHFEVKIKVPESGSYKLGLKNSGLARVYIDDELKFVNDKIHKVSGAFGLDAPEVFEELYFDANKEYLVEVDFESTVGKSSFITHYGSVSCGIEKAIEVEKSIAEAAQKAKSYDQVILITGLNKDWECEGFDRDSMGLPPYQDELIQAVVRANPNTAVVLESGSAVTAPWINDVEVFVHSNYLGEQLGNALVDVLFGSCNPSGKLPWSWPVKYEDCSSATSFKVDSNYSVTYLDDIFMGYKHFDARKISTLFPFGYGISYTDFAISNLRVDVGEDEISVEVDVANIGNFDGAEVVQVYFSRLSSGLHHPEKELKGFTKVNVPEGLKKTASVTVDKKLALSYYNTHISKWTVEKGQYKVSVGTSAENIVASEIFDVETTFNWLKLE